VLTGVDGSLRLVHWWPLLAAFVVIGLVEFMVWRFALLKPVNPDQARSSWRRLAIFATLVLAGLVLMQLIVNAPAFWP
jgi:hypothetical protein